MYKRQSQMMKQFKLDSGCYAQWRYAEHPSAPHDHILNPGQKAFEDAYQAAMAAQGLSLIHISMETSEYP